MYLTDECVRAPCVYARRRVGRTRMRLEALVIFPRGVAATTSIAKVTDAVTAIIPTSIAPSLAWPAFPFAFP